MAHKTSQGSTKLGRDSTSKRLGVKRANNALVQSGQIIVRQRGSKYEPGENVGLGKDYTIFALRTGRVKFLKKKKRNFYGRSKLKTFISVLPIKNR